MEAKLEEDLEIDSLGIVEVVMAFEDEFSIEIDDEEQLTVASDEESGWNMFTRARDIHVGAGATLHIASMTSNGSVGSGTTFKTNIMGLSQGLF